MALGFGYKRVGQAFDVFIQRLTNEVNQSINSPKDYICSIVVTGVSPRKFHFSFGFSNLPRGRYKFDFEPTATLNRTSTNVDGNTLATLDQRRNRTFRVQDDFFSRGNFNNRVFNLGYSIDGNPISISGSVAEVNNLANFENAYLGRKLQSYAWKDIEYSFENTLPFNLTTVNEIVEADNILYPDISLLELTFKASERLTSPPKTSIMVQKGQRVSYYYRWGKIVSLNSDNTEIEMDDNSPTRIFEDTSNSNRLLHVRSGRIYLGSFTTSEIFTLDRPPSGTLEVGDEVVTLGKGFTSFLPDIFVDLLLNEEYGLGSIVTPRMIDFESLLKAKKFCVEKGFYWDGVIPEPINFSNWVSSQAPASLLIPVRRNGRYGLEVERPDLPISAVFNESNILKDSYTVSTIPEKENRLNKVVLVYTDGTDERQQTKSIEVLTSSAFYGNEPPREVRKTFTNIHDVRQAIDVAITSLNSGIYQREQISLQTDYGGLDLAPGKIIVAQQTINKFDYTATGILLEDSVVDTTNGTTTVVIDKELIPETDWSNFRAYIKVYSSGEVWDYPIIEAREDNSLVLNAVFNPAPLAGDPILLYSQEFQNKKFRIQSVDIAENGISVRAVNWSRDILRFTSLDDFSGFTETFDATSGYLIRSDGNLSYHIYRE